MLLDARVRQTGQEPQAESPKPIEALPRVMRWSLAASVAALTLVLSPVSAPLAQDTPILGAMADELDRSMKSLRLNDQPAPYYIEYEVEDRASTRITARLGALVEDLAGRGRTLRVGVRVGDYSFDSSLFNAPVSGGLIPLQSDGSTSAPLDDDYDSMRRQIWLATDTAYRRAVSLFARKKAAFQNRATGDVVPDLSNETPIHTVLRGLPAALSSRDWPERAKQISAAFASARGIENSEVSIAETRGTRYYLNSEGFKVVAPIQIASLRVSADTQASDGMTLRDSFTLVDKSLDALPPASTIAARARETADRLSAQRTAPIGEEYAGPVLLEGQASAEIVMQSLVPALLGRRPPESVGRGGGRGGGGGQVTPFLRRIGLRVLSEPFSVTDTPSLREFDGRAVPGAYVVDDHGVRAKDVTLVEKGRLVTLLVGRVPLRGLLQSNGHTRGGDVQPGVLQMQSAEAVSTAELRKKYLELLQSQDKPFGYIIRGLASPGDAPGGGPGTGPMITHAVKVMRDGREEAVRGVRLGSVPPATFRDLLDASRERTLYSVRTTNTDAVSVIVPNLIFEELEVQQTREITQKPPILPSPIDD
jgi:predicted Zn-dependent protease